MPRTTHPPSRHRHDRGLLRFHTDRIVAARAVSVRHQVDDRHGGGWRGVGLPRVRTEDYLRATRQEVLEDWRTEIRLHPWTWVRLRQLADRRPANGWGYHDCGWSGDYCDVCKPRRSTERREVAREVVEAILDRQERSEQSEEGGN